MNPFKSSIFLTSCLLLAASVALSARAEDAADVGIVSHVKILSDKSEDVSNLEEWKKTYIKDGMSDQDKAIAIWKTVVKYRHQATPPDEFVQNGNNVHDPIKTIHVYGYGQCCCASSNIEGLARYIGLVARGRNINLHSVPEVLYDDTWHLFDASLMNYFPKTDGKVASVDEIRAAVMGWLDKNAPYRANDNKLREFAKNEGWKKGPELLATSKFYDANGINGAGWHGWPSNMQEYDIKNSTGYEYGPVLGYELNVQLRPGEKLTRNWFNKGLHINMPNGDPGVLKDRNALGFQRQLGDLAPGRIGNGTLEYNVPFSTKAFRSGALTADNVASIGEDKAKPALHLKDATKPGTYIVRMPTSYVYLSGSVNFNAVVGDGGSVKLSISTNQGLDWKEIAAATKSGEQSIDIKPIVYRHYDYRLKFEIAGSGSGLDALKITHDIQHSQAPLPLITEGSNTISFSAGAQEGTITYQPVMNPDEAAQHGQPSYLDFHPVVNGLGKANLIVGDTGAGDATFTVNTPGDMTRLRMSYHWRTRDAKDSFDVQVSYDDGKNFKSVQKLSGPTAGNTVYFTLTDVPAGTKKALVKLIGSQRNTACIFDMRVDADYKEPNGGFRPVKITYVWDEDGKEKKDEHIAKSATDSYTITCGPKTTAKSVIVELAE